MKTLFVIAVISVLGLLGCGHPQAPAEIVNPGFAEIRVIMNPKGREVEVAIFGKTQDEADCQELAGRIRDNLESNCKYCVSKSIECKAAISPRYAKFFDDEPSNVTYLSLNRSTSTERDVRLIFWGLTGTEGDAACDLAKQIFEKIHKGPIKCVRAVSS